MKMKFKFLGGADMVGRMGMTMEGDGMTVLVEYGLSPTKPPEFPIPAPKIDYMFLTHSHLDHCGMVPQVVGRDRCDLFTTPLTAEISELMMKDTLKIAKAEDYVQPYSMDDITINHVDVSMLDAGHIPGASMFEFSRDVKTVYSGDIHTETQRLVGGAKPTDCTSPHPSYFNHNGGGDAMGHRLWLAAHRYTPVWEDSIPLCMAEDVAGTPFDFTIEKAVGRDIGADCVQLKNVGGYDHNFVLDPAQGLRLAARLTGERSGIVMETWTEKPGVQLYAANFLETDGQTKTGVPYGRRQAVCLETQFFPDSPNHPEWGDILLRPGKRYDYTTEYRFGVRQEG